MVSTKKPKKKLRFVRVTLYSLKRQYPASLTVYRTTTNPDVATGKKNVVKAVFQIARAVLLPSDLARKFNYDHSYIVADKQFTYGAEYDVTQRAVLIDNQDLPPGMLLTVDDYAVHNHIRYAFKTVTQINDMAAHFIVMRAVTGQPTNEVFDLSVGSSLRFVQRASK